jgi:hypothetical protein
MTTATAKQTRTILVAQYVEVPAGPVNQMEYNQIGSIGSGDNSRPVFVAWSEMTDEHLKRSYEYHVRTGATTQFAALAELQSRGLA